MKRQRKKVQAGIAGLCVLFLAACGSGEGRAENKQGLSCYEAGRYEEAVAAFDEAVLKDGTCAEYYVNRAMAQLALSDFEGAKVSVTEGLRQEPENAVVYRAAGIVSYEQGNYEEACTYFLGALNILGTQKGEKDLKKDIYLYKAEAELKTGSLSEAISDYNTLISLDQKEAEYYFLRGKACALTGDLEQARGDFKKVKELKPKNMSLYVDIYLIFEENNLDDEGKEYLEEALAVGAKSEEEYKSLGAVQYLLGNYEEAAGTLEKVEADARDENTWIYLGLSKEALGDGEAAGEAYGKALAMTENRALVYYRMAESQMRAGNYTQALTCIQSGISENSSDTAKELAYAEAACYEYLGDFRTAYQKFTAYRDAYGENEKLNHEIAFLETRIQ